MTKEFSNYSLSIFRGSDCNNIPFSAFILLDIRKHNDVAYISRQRADGDKIDLSKLNIIYKITGHKVSAKFKKSMIEYLKNDYIPQLEAKKQYQSAKLISEEQQLDSTFEIKEQSHTVKTEVDNQESETQPYDPNYSEIEQPLSNLCQQISVTDLIGCPSYE